MLIWPVVASSDAKTRLGGFFCGQHLRESFACFTAVTRRNFYRQRKVMFNQGYLG